MANKLDRIEKDIAKTKAKITELQKQLRELEAAKTEQENFLRCDFVFLRTTLMPVGNRRERMRAQALGFKR